MPQTTNLIACLLMIAVCIAAGVIDARTHKIPNKLTYPAILTGLAFWAVVGLIQGRGLLGQTGYLHGTFAGSFFAMLAGLIPFMVLTSMGGLGGGDMKLMGAVGALSGMWQVVLGTTFYALAAAAVIGLFLMFRTGRTKLTLYRLIGIAVTSGKTIKPDEFDDNPKVPFAVAIALGATLAGCEHLLGLWPPLIW